MGESDLHLAYVADRMVKALNCIRCGRSEQIEEHHIVELCHGGSDDPRNKEYRCGPCHKYEHTRRLILVALFYERKRDRTDRQRERIEIYRRRLEALDNLNTPELIRERGTYLSYWSDTSLHELPRKICSKQELALNLQINDELSEAMI